jgi:Ca2+-binding EF-hand superfamily protein
MGQAGEERLRSMETVDEEFFNSKLATLFALVAPALAEGDNDKRSLQAIAANADTNKDGRLTQQEIRKCLRACGADPQVWRMKMVRKLHRRIDANHDGVLEVDELLAFLTEGVKQLHGAPRAPLPDPFSSDSEDEGIFAPKKGGSLFAKIQSSIKLGVPPEQAAERIQQYFSKSDAKSTGVVPEQKFRSARFFVVSQYKLTAAIERSCAARSCWKA